MSEFPFTWLRWYNDSEGGKIACLSGSYEALEFGSRSDREFHAEGKPPHPEYGQFQWGIACSKTSRTIVIDIDHRDQWVIGDTYIELGELADVATSVREDGQRAHTVLTVPEELLHLWPKQGPTVWGDVKSNGFSYIEGQHKSGMHYLDLDREPVEATAEILEALTRDRIFPQHGREGTGQSGMAGPWEDDSYEITSHDECLAVTCSMVRAGLTEEEIYARLALIMPNRDGEWRGRDAYIAEKIRSAQSKSEKWDREEMAVWENWSGLPYDQLSTIVLANEAEKIRAKPPEEVAQAVQAVAQHAAVTGKKYSALPLHKQLNPAGYPVEPRGNADKLISRDILSQAHYAVQFAEDEGCWLRNEGDHWATWGTKSEAAGVARSIVSAYGEYLKTEAQLKEELETQGTAQSQDDIDGDDKRKERLIKIRAKLMNTSGQSSVGTSLVTEARSDRQYSVRVADLDSEADVLWAGGYPWSLLHPELTFATDVRVVNPVHMKTASCAPVPGPTPVFDLVMEAVFPDPDVRQWALREISGRACWGETTKEQLVLEGHPGGGKSTLALILVLVLGSYAVKVDPQKILGADVSAAAEEELAALIGARLAWMDEPPPAGKQSVSKFNDLASGTGEISASRKYQNRVSAPKRFNFIICQNPRNALRMDSQGVNERMVYIPCDGIPAVTLGAWQNFNEHGAAEYPAILARLIKECALFRTGHRFEVPLAAQLSRLAAQERSDEFGAWLLEHYEPLSPVEFQEDIQTIDSRLDNSPTAGSLRTLYNGTHARDNGLSKIGAAEVRDQLKRLKLRCATAGHKRTKDVVFVSAKAVGMFSRQ